MPSASAQLAHAEPVDRFARCRRCGATDVAWVTSRRTGRPYMVQAVQDQDPVGIIWALRRSFHECDPEAVAQVEAEQVAGNTITRNGSAAYAPVVNEGFYTIVEPEGTHLTLRVRPHWEDDKAERGEQVASFLRGSDNETDYTGFAFVRGADFKVWRRFGDNERLRDALAALLNADDTDRGKAQERYALESGSCARCGRTLTVPVSIHRGFGPDCARILGIA